MIRLMGLVAGIKSVSTKPVGSVKETLDPVGKEDGDIDNDGDKDSSDKYLQARRDAIGKAMKKEGEDHEVSMANNALDDIIKNATELKAKMGEGEKGNSSMDSRSRFTSSKLYFTSKYQLSRIRTRRKTSST